MFKTIVIGDGRVGKTSLLARYADHSFSAFSMTTIGVDYKQKVLNRNGFTINLQIWDTAGQEQFNSITRSYYRGAAGIILAFDLSDKSSFDSLFNRWIPSIEDTLSTKEIACATFIVVGTKADLKSKRQVPPSEKLAPILRQRIVETVVGRRTHEQDYQQQQLGLQDESADIEYLETSAKDNLCVDECFERLVDTILARREPILRRIQYRPTEDESIMLGSTRAVNTGMWSYVSGWC